MRKMLSVSAIVFLVLPLVAIEASAGSHQSTGLVVRVDPANRTVVLVENGLHQLALIVRRATLLLDDQGRSLRTLKGLHVGDYIREECDPRGSGPALARRISVVIPAWRMLESPELWGVRDIEVECETARRFKGVIMPWQGTKKYAFGIFTVLEKSPTQSGVYALFAGDQWVYIGAARSIQIHLLTHLNGPDPCVLRHHVTSFAYETVPAEALAARQVALIREFRPVCGEGNPSENLRTLMPTPWQVSPEPKA
jgi:hypothetical protein